MTSCQPGWRGVSDTGMGCTELYGVAYVGQGACTRYMKCNLPKQPAFDWRNCGGLFYLLR